MALAERPLGRFANRGESLGQDIVERLSALEPAALSASGSEFLVGHRRDGRLERVDLLDHLSQRADVAVVGRPENGWQIRRTCWDPGLKMGAPAAAPRTAFRLEHGRPDTGRRNASLDQAIRVDGNGGGEREIAQSGEFGRRRRVGRAIRRRGRRTLLDHRRRDLRADRGFGRGTRASGPRAPVKAPVTALSMAERISSNSIAGGHSEWEEKVHG